ncbi:MAG TPA: hypothetical protein VNT01_00995 [Symbiobacteriaceae bacterium]|nr:hypothetical protein [Symbiobacteriaceae bacterium]
MYFTLTATTMALAARVIARVTTTIPLTAAGGVVAGIVTTIA